jgi:hypothetical protein
MEEQVEVGGKLVEAGARDRGKILGVHKNKEGINAFIEATFR